MTRFGNGDLRGKLDEDGEDMGDYVLVGSAPLDHWGAMVYRLEQVEVSVNMLQGVRY